MDLSCSLAGNWGINTLNCFLETNLRNDKLFKDSTSEFFYFAELKNKILEPVQNIFLFLFVKAVRM